MGLCHTLKVDRHMARMKETGKERKRKQTKGKKGRDPDTNTAEGMKQTQYI